MNLKDVETALNELVARYDDNFTDRDSPPDLEELCAELLLEYENYERLRELVRNQGLKRVKYWMDTIEEECKNPHPLR